MYRLNCGKEAVLDFNYDLAAYRQVISTEHVLDSLNRLFTSTKKGYLIFQQVSINILKVCLTKFIKVFSFRCVYGKVYKKERTWVSHSIQHIFEQIIL